MFKLYYIFLKELLKVDNQVISDVLNVGDASTGGSLGSVKENATVTTSPALQQFNLACFNYYYFLNMCLKLIADF